MARNFTKQSNATASGIINLLQFVPSPGGEINEESFLVWFNKHIKNYYTIAQTDILLFQNLASSKAYTDEQLQQFYTKIEIDDKVNKLQSQIDILSGEIDLTEFGKHMNENPIIF